MDVEDADSLCVFYAARTASANLHDLGATFESQHPGTVLNHGSDVCVIQFGNLIAASADQKLSAMGVRWIRTAYVCVETLDAMH